MSSLSKEDGRPPNLRLHLKGEDDEPGEESTKRRGTSWENGAKLRTNI